MLGTDYPINTKYCAHILDEHTYTEPLKSLLESIVDTNDVNPIKRNAILEQAPYDKKSYKDQACDAIFHYAEAILADNILTDSECNSIRLLKLYLKIEEGDFIKYHKEGAIKHLLQGQLQRLYSDGLIEIDEALMASKMQGLFGLSATMYGEFEDEVKMAAIANGADRIDLIRNK